MCYNPESYKKEYIKYLYTFSCIQQLTFCHLFYLYIYICAHIMNIITIAGKYLRQLVGIIPFPPKHFGRHLLGRKINDQI